MLRRACCDITKRLASLCGEAVPGDVKRKDEKRAADSGTLDEKSRGRRSRSSWDFGIDAYMITCILRRVSSTPSSMSLIARRRTFEREKGNMVEVILIQQEDHGGRKACLVGLAVMAPHVKCNGGWLRWVICQRSCRCRILLGGFRWLRCHPSSLNIYLLHTSTAHAHISPAGHIFHLLHTSTSPYGEE